MSSRRRVFLVCLLLLPALAGWAATPAAADEAAEPFGPSPPAGAATGDDGPVPLASTTTLRANRDAFVSSVNPGSNYGSDLRLIVGQRSPYGATRSLVQFDMDDLDEKEAVTDARLRLYLREAGTLADPNRDIVLYRVEGSWDEGGVTWASFPGFRDERIGSIGMGIGSGWQEWRNLKDLVKRWRLPRWQSRRLANHGIYVQGYETAGSYRTFDSREGSNDPELRLEHVTDTVPPTSRLNPLPPYINQPDAGQPDRATFALSWSGEDPEPDTGIAFFRLFAQRNEGAWVMVRDELEKLGDRFTAENGGIYRFTVYAVDVAGNVEPPKGPEAQTHVDLSPPITTMQPLDAYVRGPFPIAWSGVDQPTGVDQVASGIVAYNVYFRINGGEWRPAALGVTHTTAIFGDPLVQGGVYEFQAGAYDRAGNLEVPTLVQARTLLDGLPPVVRFQPVPQGHGPTFTVVWEGIDFGGSGVVSYDVQVREDTQPWRDWLANTTELSQVLQGSYSHTYCFRARARDAAGNLGEYPSSPQLVVGVYDPAIWVERLVLPRIG